MGVNLRIEVWERFAQKQFRGEATTNDTQPSTVTLRWFEKFMSNDFSVFFFFLSTPPDVC